MNAGAQIVGGVLKSRVRNLLAEYLLKAKEIKKVTEIKANKKATH